ncbi:hypothetical protein EPUS_03648 [Endocarpon pusillum Z07020]|uniref:Probable guanine deaminase n=1 Tax=Endocarpon pusillum (strain Z07020 / HMAS-L-300199) TaxID=1263415 RepID=U1GD94_ENDPU|nr:uncharacterized protein EPUS_03648 [Endocarpon pusillum Z07020]ERF69656.1 hypothetical protein EPUS_03648 [Endocarpon pusillum Z07020]
MASSVPRTVYLGTFISAPHAGPEAGLEIRDGAVLVSAGGVIEKCDWSVRSAEEARAVFGVGEEVGVRTLGEGEGNGFWFPGFVDTHIHAPQYPNTGIFGQSTLLDWLETYTFPLESSLGNPNSPLYTSHPTHNAPTDPLTRAKQIYRRVISRTLASGTTTAAYYATIHVEATNALADLALELGQRALIGRVCMDEARTCPEYYRDESTEVSMANSRACVEHCRTLDPSGERIKPILTPRFAPSCQLSTLTALARLAKQEHLMVQTHISETTSEIEMVRRMFPDSDSYAAVYDDAGLLGEKTILAHAVHLSKEERALVRERKAKVAHCPASNSALGSGYCPVRTLLEEGIDVGLGTDVSGGFSLSVLEAVRQAYLVSRTVAYHAGGNTKYNIGLAEGLHLATVGGAKVVGMEGRMGAFREGMLWDVQEVGLGRVDGNGKGESSAVDLFGWEFWEEKVAKWVWNGDDRNVKRVWIGGRLVHGQD